MKKLRSLLWPTILICCLLLFSSACGGRGKNPVVGKWVETTDSAHQIVITEQGDTLIVEEKNTKMPDLNSRSLATYKDGVLRLESGFGRPTMFYDAAKDRLTGQSNLGKVEFKRQL
ncbi:MAG: hypothetical protein QOH25_1498 [Acidobacteriota bacterium]|jgi:hypothetical protein|nr:hypothetical protein [Acidobacteriota bacterium]